MRISKILVILILLLAFSCKKDAPPEPTGPVMPPLTHQGLNTFGCYINGELFVANDGSSYWSAPALSGSFDDESFLLRIQANRELERDGSSMTGDNIRFRVIINEGEKFYPMHFDTDHFKGYMSYNMGMCRYYHDLDNKGTCEITYLNTEKNIISGRFQMTLINPDCESDSLLKITDGRFDFKY